MQLLTILCRAYHDVSLYLAYSLTCALQSAVARFNADLSASVSATAINGAKAAPQIRTVAVSTQTNLLKTILPRSRRAPF